MPVRAFKFDDPRNRKRITLKHERQLARQVGGRPQPASGAIDGYKGDVITDQLLLDLKETDKQSQTVTVAALHKIQREADGAGREPALVLRFNNVTSIEKSWAVLPLSVLRGLLEGER